MSRLRTRCSRGAALLALGCALLAGVAGCGGHGRPRLLLGVDDDTVKWIARPDRIVAIDRALGLDAVRITLDWHGQVRPSPVQRVYLHRIAATVALGERVVLAVYGTARDAPLDAAARARYCTFVVRVLRRLPEVRDVVVWNEANNPYFWPAAAGAAPYEALLASAWDALHGLRDDVNVIDSTAPHQDPGSFLAAIGAAYRQSGRTRPILDTFGHDAYPAYSAEPPGAHHADGSIDEGDYDRLVRVLGDAFGGTAQPVPGEGETTIWYLEDGFQTAVPAPRRRGYRGVETAKSVLAPTQAKELAAAVELAACQPYVGAFFNFELQDEHRLAGWQSGLVWADGTRKPAFAAYRQAIAAVHGGEIACPSR